MTHIAVILVNYNTREYLARALASIYATLLPDGWRVTTTVVDNNSHDQSASMVTQDFPQVDLIAATENLGFTSGNNLALDRLGFPIETPVSQSLPKSKELKDASPPDYVLLLNPDAELVDDALVQMVRCLESRPTAAICGAQLRYGDGRFQHGAFMFPGLGQVLLDFFPLTGIRGANRFHDSRFNGRYPATCWQQSRPFSVDFVLGAALMARGSAIRQIGGLDEGYFMYCEEMDWCLRLQKAGWEVVTQPTAHVVHHEGRSSRQVRHRAYVQLWRSRLRFYAKFPERFSPTFQRAIRLVIQLGTAWQIHLAHRRFAAGELTGVELAQEVAAHQAVQQL